MNKFVCTALAATLASTTGLAAETDWPELDRELEALNSTLSTQGSGGPQLSGWVIMSLDVSGDVMPNGVDDLGGVNLRSVRLNVTGETADYGYKVSTDLNGGTAVLLDAYGTLNFTENFSLRMGNYKTPFLASQMRAANRELFLQRTFISGGSFADGNVMDPFAIGAGRDAGLMLFGNFAETIGWWISAQNGADSTANNFDLTARLAWDALGEGAGQSVDGAYNAGDGTNMTVAVAYSEDSSETDANGNPLLDINGLPTNGDDVEQIGGEVYFTSGPFYIGGEIVSRGTNVGDNTPFTITGSYLFNEDWEVVGRYEGHDDTPIMIGGVTPDLADNTIGVGVNKYVSGHDVKWQLQYTNSSFQTADDIGVFSLGLVLSF